MSDSAELSLRSKLDFKRGLREPFVEVFRPELPEMLHRWDNNGFTRKMANGHRSKRHILGLINSILNTKKNSFDLDLKTPRPFSHTQYIVQQNFPWGFQNSTDVPFSFKMKSGFWKYTLNYKSNGLRGARSLKTEIIWKNVY